MRRLLNILIALLILSSTASAAIGKIQTTLYLNGKLYDQFTAPRKIKVPANEWKEWLNHSKSKDKYGRPIIRFNNRWNVRLNIKNNSDMAMENALLKINVGENWGNETEKIMNLEPPLQSGDSIDFNVNLNDYEFVGDDQTSICVMIALSKDENIPANENYWCIWFELA